MVVVVTDNYQQLKAKLLGFCGLWQSQVKLSVMFLEILQGKVVT